MFGTFTSVQPPPPNMTTEEARAYCESVRSSAIWVSKNDSDDGLFGFLFGWLL